MTQARHFVLTAPAVRERAAGYLLAHAPDGWEVTVTPPRMSGGQKARFHAMCDDIERSGIAWEGKARTALEWKVLLISAHAVATGSEAEMVRGIEGELVNVRESTTSMTRQRGASLIEYASAFCAARGVRLRAPKSED